MQKHDLPFSYSSPKTYRLVISSSYAQIKIPNTLKNSLKICGNNELIGSNSVVLRTVQRFFFFFINFNFLFLKKKKKEEEEEEEEEEESFLFFKQSTVMTYLFRLKRKGLKISSILLWYDDLSSVKKLCIMCFIYTLTK